MRTILKGISISKIQQYSYANELEAFYPLVTDTFSLRSKVEYDEFGELSSLIIYKPEGALKYSKKDVLDDLQLLDYTGFSLKQNVLYINDTLLVYNTDTLKVKLTRNNKGKNVLINQQNRNVTIFEL